MRVLPDEKSPARLHSLIVIAVAIPLFALFSAMSGGPAGLGFGFWPFPRITVRRVLNLPEPAHDKTSLEVLSLPSCVRAGRIVIDAGHGGRDEGASGPHGVREKEVVLDVALRLSHLLQNQMGAEVILTRSDDSYVDLPTRVAAANSAKADMFISIHANSAHSPAAAGIETYFVKMTSNPASLEVAARDRSGDARSEALAQLVQTSVSAGAGQDRGVKSAPFLVLLGGEMPAVLAEIGFLSNQAEESDLNRPEYRQHLAQDLLTGIARYADSLNEPQCSNKALAGILQRPLPIETLRAAPSNPRRTYTRVRPGAHWREALTTGN